MSFSFTSEQEMFRASVRAFARDKLAAGYLARAHSDEFPRQEVSQLGEQGLLAATVAPEHGGQGADAVSVGIMLEELGWADFNVAYHAFQSILMGELLGHAKGADGAWLRGVLSGERLMAAALTEPGCGSDLGALRTRAEAVHGGWRLNGEKTSVTTGPHADALFVWARTGGAGARGVSVFLVPTADESIARQTFRDPGLRPNGRGAFTFEDTFVPEHHLVGELGRGFPLVMSEFDQSRVGIGCLCIGAAQRALDVTVEYLTERRAFGQPLSAFEGVSFPVAEHATLLEAARALCLTTLGRRQAGRAHTAQAAMIKWWVPQVAFAAIQECVVLHGHVAWSEELPLQALLRDVSGFQIAEGTPQVQKLIIARQLFGRENVGDGAGVD